MTKKNMYLCDVETAGTLENPLVYDFGGHPLSINGEVIGENESTVIDEVYYGMKDEMANAYYAKKIPEYEEKLWNGEIDAKNILALRKQIHTIFKRYNIKYVCAHNAKFDVKALNNTIRQVTNGRIKYFFPYGIEVWDTLKMARQLLSKKPSYIKFCKENGYMTNHKIPRPRLTAEVIYRFITKDLSFNEDHSGFDDVKIETEIYKYLVKQHKKCNKTLYHAPSAYDVPATEHIYTKNV